MARAHKESLPLVPPPEEYDDLPGIESISRFDEEPDRNQFKGLELQIKLSTLRLMAAQIRRMRGFSTKETEAFLLLYREELQQKLTDTVKEFLKEKLA